MATRDPRATEVVVLDEDLAIVAIPSAMRALVGAIPGVGDRFVFRLDGHPTTWVATRTTRRDDDAVVVWLSREDDDGDA